MNNMANRHFSGTGPKLLSVTTWMNASSQAPYLKLAFNFQQEPLWVQGHRPCALALQLLHSKACAQCMILRIDNKTEICFETLHVDVG